MNRMQNQLKNRLEHNGIGVLNINLYDLTIKILKDRNIRKTGSISPSLSGTWTRAASMNRLRRPKLKSIDRVKAIHEAQLLSHMKLAQVDHDFLINFNVEVLKNGIKSFVL